MGSLGVGLISMVANYSLEKSKSKVINRKIRDILKKSENLKKRLLLLVDLDAQAYLKVIRSGTKDVKARKAALKKARDIPMEVCRLSYKAIQLTPYLVKNGNKYLLSDIEVAIEFLQAAYNASMIHVRINK